MSDETVALAVTVGMSIVPSLLFLGLWHGLQRLRDDQLVDDVLTRARSGAADPTTVEPHAYLGAGDPAEADDEPDPARETGLEPCPECLVLRPPNGEPCPGCGTDPHATGGS